MKQYEKYLRHKVLQRLTKEERKVRKEETLNVIEEEEEILDVVEEENLNLVEEEEETLNVIEEEEEILDVVEEESLNLVEEEEETLDVIEEEKKVKLKEEKNTKMRSNLLKGIGIFLVLGVVGSLISHLLNPSVKDVYIEKAGTSNGNQLECSLMNEVPEKYLYYVNDQELYICPWDSKNEEYPIETKSRKLYPLTEEEEKDFYNVTNINIGDQYIYCRVNNYNDKPDTIVRMNLDGSDLQAIWSEDEVWTDDQKTSGIYCLNYVKDSIEAEYLYYIVDSDSELDNYTLYRYNIMEEKVEKLLEEDINHYNLYQNYIYYTVQKGTNSYLLKRSKLDGSSCEILSDSDNISSFVIENDILCGYSKNKEYDLIVYDLAQEKLTGRKTIDLDSFADWGFQNGKIYYRTKKELHQMDADGTGDATIADGSCYANRNFLNHKIYYSASYYLNQKKKSFGIAYIMDMEDKSTICLSEGATIQNTDEAIYIVKDGMACLESYDYEDGKKANYMTLPRILHGIPVNQSYEEGNFEDVIVFKTAEDSELTTETVDGGVSITSYSGEITGKEDSLALPEYIDGNKVVAIGEKAFEEHDFRNLILPDGIEKIGKSAFLDCSNLNWIQWPNNLKKIESFAFWLCPFTNFALNLPEKLEKIGFEAFGYNRFKSVYIPASVTEISMGAFVACANDSLEILNVDENNTNYMAKDGMLYSKDGKTLLAYLVKNGNSCTIPEGTEVIGDSCFHGLKISNVVIPNTVHTIGYYAFEYCSNLTGKLVLPKSVTKIEKEAFKGTGITSVKISKNCDVGSSAFDFGIDVEYYE